MKSCFGECETDPALRRLWDADYVSGITIVASTTLLKDASVFRLTKDNRGTEFKNFTLKVLPYNPSECISKVQEAGIILRIGFALLKWPLSQRLI